MRGVSHLGPCLVVAMTIAACGGDEPADDSGSATTPPSTVLATTAPTTTETPATEPATSVMSAPSSSTTVGPTTTSTTVPAPATPTADPTLIEDLLAEITWEGSGIGRDCVTVEGGGGWCTQVVHDPSGAPVSFDPVTKTLTRHTREDGEFVQTTLPESLDGYLIAAGPDDIVYINTFSEQGAEGVSDLVAISLAAEDAGREIERFVGGGNPGSDFDLVPTASGITTTDWYGQGQRPASDRSTTPWVRRVGSPEVRSTGVAAITIDAYESTVTVDGRTWRLTGEAAQIAPTGMPPIVRTFDGGFIARYDDFVVDPRSVVVRGWPDGTVDEWIVPSGPNFEWSIVPEPMGTVLIDDGDWFARAAPFDQPERAWSGRLDTDLQTGVVDVSELNAHLASLDWSQPQPPWDIGPTGFVVGVFGLRQSPAELSTIDVLRTNDDGGVAIVAVTERFLDDSVYATRHEIDLAPDGRSVMSMTWANSCQPDRGHQDFRIALCT